MPILSPSAWILSAVPLMPVGNLVGSGIICPVVLSLSFLMDQQSSTEYGSQNLESYKGEHGGLTVDVFISSIFKAEVHNFVRCCHDLRLIDIAAERVPGVPSQSWQFSLPLGQCWLYLAGRGENFTTSSFKTNALAPGSAAKAASAIGEYILPMMMNLKSKQREQCIYI
jgi:hypothetical protein